MMIIFPKGAALALAAAITTLIALPDAAQAQRYNEESPSREAQAGTIGSQFSTYRNALISRRGSATTPVATQDGTILSGEEGSSWGGPFSAWASVDTKFLNGTYSGNSTSLIFGADTLVGGTTLIGLIGGYNRSSVGLPFGQKVKADGFSIGPYFSTQLSETVSLDGFVAYGEPDYDVDGGQFTGKKLFGNLTLTGTVPLANADLYPFISIASAREKLPAFTSVNPVVAYGATEIKGLVGTIGTSVGYNAIERDGRIYLPRAGVEVDFVRNDDGFGNEDSFQTLRINGGVSIIGDTGAWSLGADLGRTSEGTTTVGANATYVWQF